jgi:hypothetical protein
MFIELSPKILSFKTITLYTMAKRIAKKSENTTGDGFAYLTKRVVVSKAGQATRNAYNEALITSGSVVKEEDGWIVRKHQDGRIDRISVVK